MTHEDVEKILCNLEAAYVQVKIANHRLDQLPDVCITDEQQMRWGSVMDKLQDIING